MPSKRKPFCYLHSLESFKLTHVEGPSINTHNLVCHLLKYVAVFRKPNKMLNSVRVEGRITWKILSHHYLKKAGIYNVEYSMQLCFTISKRILFNLKTRGFGEWMLRKIRDVEKLLWKRGTVMSFYILMDICIFMFFIFPYIFRFS